MQNNKPKPLQLTFHLPLHRYLAVFLSMAVRHQNLVDIGDVLPSHEFLQLLMLHPLQLQVKNCIVVGWICMVESKLCRERLIQNDSH